MADTPAPSRTGVEALCSQVRNIGTHEEGDRLDMSAQWSEGGVQQQKVRSISIRGGPEGLATSTRCPSTSIRLTRAEMLMK